MVSDRARASEKEQRNTNSEHEPIACIFPFLDVVVQLTKEQRTQQRNHRAHNEFFSLDDGSCAIYFLPFYLTRSSTKNEVEWLAENIGEVGRRYLGLLFHAH